MRKALIFLAPCLLFFQSCFEIVEKIELKANGSGTATFIVNMSQSKTKLNSIMKAKVVNGEKIPSKDEIEKKISELEQAVRKVKGISSVSTNLDFKNYIARFQCSFKNIENLNEVVKHFQNKGIIDGGFSPNYYSYNIVKKEFLRKNPINFREKYTKLNAANRKVFQNAEFTSVYQFQNIIQSKQNKNSSISKSKKAILLKSSIIDLIQNKKVISNRIQLK